MRIGQRVIDASAEEGARILALGLLSEADAAADRLVKGGEEAFHDFRVALRRVRTALRAFHPWLAESVKPRQERKLKKIARSTNLARDVQVQLAWLRSRRKALPASRQRAGLDLLIARFETLLRSDAARAGVTERYRLAARKLSRRLGCWKRRAGGAGGVAGASLGGVMATLLGDHFDSLRDRMTRIQGPADEKAVHEARIGAKRLRYLLEPLHGYRRADASAPVRRLKRLQDVLGELHDSHLLAGEVRDALATGAERALPAAVRDPLRGSPRPRLLAAARLVRERRDALYADLEREWRPAALEALEAEVNVVAAALTGRAGGRHERERGVGAVPRS